MTVKRLLTTCIFILLFAGKAAAESECPRLVYELRLGGELHTFFFLVDALSEIRSHFAKDRANYQLGKQPDKCEPLGEVSLNVRLATPGEIEKWCEADPCEKDECECDEGEDQDDLR
jgi:hypothetical protein